MVTIATVLMLHTKVTNLKDLRNIENHQNDPLTTSTNPAPATRRPPHAPPTPLQRRPLTPPLTPFQFQ